MKDAEIGVDNQRRRRVALEQDLLRLLLEVCAEVRQRSFDRGARLPAILDAPVEARSQTRLGLAGEDLVVAVLHFEGTGVGADRFRFPEKQESAGLERVLK